MVWILDFDLRQELGIGLIPHSARHRLNFEF